MNLFLTGASGFLGSHTVRELVQRGHRVSALVRKTSVIESLRKLPIQWVEASLPDCQGLRAHLKEIDAVIHIAGVIKALSKEEFFRINAHGTDVLVQEVLAAESKPKTFLYVSTVAALNPGQDGGDFCIASSQCHPLSSYGQSKLAGEKALTALQGKVRSLILRPPVLYGPGDREMLPLFRSVRRHVAPLYGKGGHQFSVCYVSDVARAIAMLVESNVTLPQSPPIACPPAVWREGGGKREGNEIFCLDDGKIHTWRSLASDLGQIQNKKFLPITIPPFLFPVGALFSQTYAKITQKPAIFTLDKLKELSQRSWVCGHQKLSQMTGWRPEVDFKTGARETLSFYLQEGWLR